MKTNLKKFLNIKKLFSKSSNKDSRELISPMREWAIGLAFSAIVFFVGIGFTAFDFYTQLVSEPEIEAENKQIVYRDNEVRLYDNIYKEKEKTFNSLRLKRDIPVPVVGGNTDSDSDAEDEVDPSEEGDIEVISQ